jgi:hypothetical protein
MVNTHIKVIEVLVTIETTVVVCDKCGQYLSIPKSN